MVDIQYIKTHTEEMRTNMKNRNADPSVLDELLAVEEKKQILRRNLEEKNRQRNENADKLKNIQDKRSPEAQEIITNGRRIKEEIQQAENDIAPIETRYQELMYQIPNITDPTMPVGKSSNDNVEIKVGGTKRSFSFQPKDHVELGKYLDIIDVERSAKVSGSRFGFLKNEAVLMEFAIIMHLTNKLIARGFHPILPPVLVKESAMYGTGYFPMEKTQAYQIASENIEDNNKLYLAGTGEVPTVSYHADEIFDELELPIKYFAFSPCFRSEVGSWGKDVRGIKRVHQFDKLEMIIFAHPDQSKEILEELLSINEEFLNDLKLPYHVLNMCTGDVGYPTYKKYDVEVFIPSQNDYCETMSTSNINTYQARRLNMRYRKSDGSLDYIHTLNSTGAAMGRILLSIIENYQQEDGTVRIPDVLMPYIGNNIPDGIIKPKK